MKLLAVFLPFTLCAQTLTLGAATSSPSVGVKTTLSLNLSGSVGKNITAVQFAHSLPVGISLASGAGMASPDQGTPAASKSLYCAGLTTNTTCIVIGVTPIGNPTNTALADGPVYTVAVTPTAPGPLTFTLGQLFAVDTSGMNVAIAAGPALTFTVAPSKCDPNRDGVINNADTQLVISAILGTAACPVGFTCSATNLVAVMLASMPGGSCLL